MEMRHLDYISSDVKLTSGNRMSEMEMTYCPEFGYRMSDFGIRNQYASLLCLSPSTFLSSLSFFLLFFLILACKSCNLSRMNFHEVVFTKILNPSCLYWNHNLWIVESLEHITPCNISVSQFIRILSVSVWVRYQLLDIFHLHNFFNFTFFFTHTFVSN